MKTPIFMMFKEYNAWTKLSIEYLLKNTDKNKYRIIFINNGCYNESKDIVIDKDVEHCFIDHKIEIGVSCAYNRAIKSHIVEEEFFVILHNDVFVSSGWLEELIDCYNDNKKEIYAVYPRSNYYAHEEDLCLHLSFIKNKLSPKKYLTTNDIESNMYKTYEDFNGFYDYSKTISREYHTACAFKNELYIFCTLFDSKLFLESGGFDEDFIYVGSENVLYHEMMSAKKKYSCHSIGCYVHHQGNATSDGYGKDYLANKEYNEKILKNKIEKLVKNNNKKLEISTKITRGDLNVLAIREDGIGDIIITMYGLAALKNISNKIEITYASRKEYNEFIKNFECVDNVLPIPDNLLPHNKYDVKNIEEHYKKDFDIILCWSKYFELINKDKKDRIDLIIKNINEKLFLDIKDIVKPRLEIEDNDDFRNCVVVCPSSTSPYRKIPESTFLPICQIESKENKVVLLSDNFIDIDIDDNFCNLSGKTNIIDLFSIIKNAKMVYTADSAALHIASLFNIKTKAFFGSIDSSWRNKYYKDNVVCYEKDIPCRPCNDIGCKEVSCMKYNYNEILDIIHDDQRKELE